jgi:DNA polymerase III alpha subunit
MAKHGNMYKIGGIIDSTRNGVSKAGNPYCIFTIEDYFGTCEFALFGKNYDKWAHYAVNNIPVCVSFFAKEKKPYNGQPAPSVVEFTTDIMRIEYLDNM